LLKGDSVGGLWDVSSDVPEARIAVGTDARCGWVVHGAGVAPFHFELYWDGMQLWVGNSAGAPNVTIDGEPLGDWRPVTGRARIEFGRAAMLVEASEAVPSRVSMPGARDSRELAAEATRIASPAAERREVYASGQSALQKLPPNAPVMHSGESFADAVDERTRLEPELQAALARDNATRVLSVEEAQAQRSLGPMPGVRPGIGLGAGVGVGAGVRRVAAEPAPVSEEATRLAGPPLVAAPAPPVGTLGPPGSLGVGAGVGVGTGAARVGGPGAGIGPGADTSGGSRVGTTSGGLGGLGTGGGAFGAGGGPPLGPGQAPTAAPASAGLSGPVAGGPSPFAAPPPPAPDNTTQAIEKLNERLKSQLAQAKPQFKLSQPPRTWLLLGLVVAVFVVFVLDSGKEEGASNDRSVRTTVGDAAATVAGAAGAASGGTGVPGPAVDAGMPALPTLPGSHRLALQQLPGMPLGLVGTSGTWDPATGPPDGSTVLPDGGVMTAERAAADLFVAGRWQEALLRYRALAQAHPENPAYAQIAEILQRRLRAQCRNGVLPNGAPCPP
jgi:hypothetical protein